MIPVGDSEKLSRPPWVNLTLIVLNVGIFLYIFFLLKDPSGVIRQYGFVPAHFLKGGWNPILYWKKYIPLFTSLFIHAGYLHIIGNMLFLYTFGDNIEDRLGHARYLLFYLLCGVISLLIHTYAYKTSTTVVVGASGAIAGVMGGFYILFPHTKVRSFFVFFTKEIPSIYYLFVWFMFNLIRGLFYTKGLSFEQVAWWTHIGGFIAGALLVNMFVVGAPQIKAKVKVKTGKRAKRK